MKVLVIGGAGYIGSHVALELLENKHEVTVFDNFSSGQKVNLFPEEKVIEADIMDYSSLIKCMKQGYDALIHLAAFKAAGESMIKPQKYSDNNITGTINILNAASETGIKNIVFSSSAAVFGEPDYLPVDEDHPKNPENYYGFTKLNIEYLLSWYDKLLGIKFAALRYFNAAGYDPEGRIKGLEIGAENLLPVIMDIATGRREKLKIFGGDWPTKDGTGVRDYIHVTDLGKAHLLSLEYIVNKKESLILNLGSEHGISVQEMLDTTRKVTGKPIPSEVVDRRPGDPAKLVASSKKAHEILNWKAGHSDVETLVRTAWEIYKNG
jgi:UDP-glucose 4-epimerase